MRSGAASPCERTYVRRDPSRSVLHRVVDAHLADFLAEFDRREDGPRIPDFVRRAFDRFTTCGDLGAGFARFVCKECKTERLVAFTCKGRGFCPSCVGRRMIAKSAARP